MVRSSPTVVNGTVFVGSYDHNLYAVDAETGNKQWALETGGKIHSSPTVVDGTIFVGSRDTNLYTIPTDSEIVKTRRKQRSDVINVLQPAERSIQEGIVGFAEDNHTVARIRFRQARDEFTEAMKIIDQSDIGVFPPSIEVNVVPQQRLSSTILSELPSIPDTAASALSEAGIETIGDLINIEVQPWVLEEVAELVDAGELTEEEIVSIITVFSWLHDGDYEFSSAEAISRRQQQADYGFERAK
jgi:hypothetical protein